jgi:hypothetical protein
MGTREKEFLARASGWAALAFAALNGGCGGEAPVEGATAAQMAAIGGPTALPGRIQAEDYDTGGENVGYYDTTPGNSGGQYRQDDVDIETTTDTGGGYDVGWIAAGEWLQYTVNVATAGTYQFTARVASAVTGTKTLGLTLDGATLGQASFTDASGWQSWNNLSIGAFALSAGSHTLRIQMVTGGFNLNYLDVTQQSTAISLPGRVEAENYDPGGENVGYYDTTPGNSGGQYRQDDVDIEATTDTGGGYDVGWTAAGEWLQYTVNVATAGTYQFTARVASAAAGTKTLGLTLDGATLGQASFTDASGWQSWNNLPFGAFPLSAGIHKLRVQMVTGGFNLNYVDVAQQATGASLPGRIQAENYDPGGENVGYYDTTPGNTGGQYRQDDVDIEATTDTGGGYDVGWTAAGEWLQYTVNVATAGTYQFTARVASGAAGTKTLGLTLDGAALGQASFTDASGWQSWNNLPFGAFPLSAGNHALRIQMVTGGFNINYLDVASDSDAYGPCFDAPKTSKVLVLVYDEYHEAVHHDEGTHNHAKVDPVATSHQLVDIFRQSSHGLVNYEITDVRFINSQPPQLSAPMPGNTADYGAIFQQNNICNLVQTQNLSEVWMWGDGTAGFDEVAYKVPNDAVPNDAQAESQWFYDLRKKNIPDCGKTIWAMGWNYEVPIENAIHTYNHRVEGIVSLLVGQGHWLQPVDPNNPWSKFSRYDLMTSPGVAGVGTTHDPANASADYDYTNTTLVASTANDFLNYPNLTGATTQISCTAWGCSQLGYQEWYDSHLPHVAGTSYMNTCNSWWTYIADFDRRLTPCSGSSCLQPIGGLCGINDECASGNCACGQCAAAGSTPTCLGAAFDSCSGASQCQSGICGCPGESAPTECLPNSTYSQTCTLSAGASCWGDSDCTSGICGCNGGATVMCLSAGQSRACASVVNWANCLQDTDCTSGVCGCNGGPLPMVCLPSSQYSRTCTN